MSEICDADKESCQRLLLSSSSSIVESNSESEPNSSLGVDSESKEISDQAQVLDNNVIANYNIEPKVSRETLGHFCMYICRLCRHHMT